MRKRTGALVAVATAIVVSLAGAGASADICRSNEPTDSNSYDPDNLAERLGGFDLDFKLITHRVASSQPMGFGLDWKICIDENPDS